MRRRTKIVCTLGPATESPAVLEAMIQEGMDVARFNLSHGDHADHARRLLALRAAERTTGHRVAVLWDLRGPEVRLILPGGGPVTVTAGEEMLLPPTTWDGLEAVLQPGQLVLMADGAIPATVVGTAPARVRFLGGGVLRQRSKLALPGIRPDLPPLGGQDRDDIRFGAEAGADLYAMSLVRDPRDLLLLRDELRALGQDAATIAKIETPAAYQNLRPILAVSDGVMVARGDLGVECPIEEVPAMQKHILALANRLGKPGITATEMLESMTRQPRPTRAEASDVFNAVLDGTDALMLSGETAIGDHPVAAVSTMHRIALEAERLVAGRWAQGTRPVDLPDPEGEAVRPAVAIAGAAVWAASAVGASAIVTPTRSGYTARMVSRLRPAAPIIAVSPDQRTVNVLRLTWGVQPLYRVSGGGADTVESSLETAVAADLIRSGDLVVITAGVPSGVPGTTNMLQLRTIGEVLARGVGIAGTAAAGDAGRSVVSGPLCVVADPGELASRFVDGSVLVSATTDASYVPYMQRAAAIVVADAGLSSHPAIVGLNLGKPVVLGVRSALSLPHGELVTVDAGRGVIYRGRVRPV